MTDTPAHLLGLSAGVRGDDVSTCPYPQGTSEYAEWCRFHHWGVCKAIHDAEGHGNFQERECSEKTSPGSLASMSSDGRAATTARKEI
jgi:hypothetical protein